MPPALYLFPNFRESISMSFGEYSSPALYPRWQHLRPEQHHVAAAGADYRDGVHALHQKRTMHEVCSLHDGDEVLPDHELFFAAGRTLAHALAMHEAKDPCLLLFSEPHGPRHLASGVDISRRGPLRAKTGMTRQLPPARSARLPPREIPTLPPASGTRQAGRRPCCVFGRVAPIFSLDVLLAGQFVLGLVYQALLFLPAYLHGLLQQLLGAVLSDPGRHFLLLHVFLE